MADLFPSFWKELPHPDTASAIEPVLISTV
jgi:hypothetical protein